MDLISALVFWTTVQLLRLGVLNVDEGAIVGGVASPRRPSRRSSTGSPVV